MSGFPTIGVNRLSSKSPVASLTIGHKKSEAANKLQARIKNQFADETRLELFNGSQSKN